VSATRRLFSAIPNSRPASISALTGIVPRRSVDRRSRTKLLAEGFTVPQITLIEENLQIW
jgi:hypothetical protein